MKKAIALMLTLAVMLCGCGEAAGSYVNLASVPNTGNQIIADDAGNLYYLDMEEIYTVNGSEKTLFARAADILPYMGDRHVDRAEIYIADWYEGKLYIWDSRDHGIWEYDPDAGTSVQLPVEFEINEEDFAGTAPMVYTLVVHNGWLYIRVTNNDLWRYNFETKETFFYRLDTNEPFMDYFHFGAADETTLYLYQNKTAWKLDIASGECTDLDVSFIRETEGEIFSQLFLDGYGDVYYTTVNARMGDIISLYRGTTDNSVPCERIDLPTEPVQFLFDCSGWLYYRDEQSIWRYDMKKERVELFITPPSGSIHLFGSKIYIQQDDDAPHEYAILADLDALD